MSQTVVALFENTTESQKAVHELEKAGITQERVDISKGYMPKDNQPAARSGEDKDGITRFFDALFGSDDDSKRISEVARTCGSIVTVHANSAEEARKAAMVLDQAGASSLDDLERKCGITNTGMPAGTANKQQTTPGAGTTIPIIKEEVQIGKRQVESGGVQIKSWIVERPVQENLRLREEHIKVERNQVNRKASDADFKAFKQGEATFTEHKEVPVVSKEAKVVEEVRIGKEVDSRQETIRETERKTEVDVKRTNPNAGTGPNSGNNPNSNR